MYAELIQPQMAFGQSLGGFCKPGRKPVDAPCLDGLMPAHT